VYSWGLGIYGQLGAGNRLNHAYPINVTFPASLKGDKVLKIACGALHTLVLTGNAQGITSINKIKNDVKCTVGVRETNINSDMEIKKILYLRDCYILCNIC
jgi:alpha-tubulin suppressor-like RCC1 family protein